MATYSRAAMTAPSSRRRARISRISTQKFTVAVLATLAALAIGLALTTAPAKAATVPPGGCGIVIKDTIKETVARTSEGQIVRLSDKVNVLIFRPKAGHLVACWDEKTPEPRR